MSSIVPVMFSTSSSRGVCSSFVLLVDVADLAYCILLVVVAELYVASYSPSLLPPSGLSVLSPMFEEMVIGGGCLVGRVEKRAWCVLSRDGWWDLVVSNDDPLPDNPNRVEFDPPKTGVSCDVV